MRIVGIICNGPTQGDLAVYLDVLENKVEERFAYVVEVVGELCMRKGLGELWGVFVVEGLGYVGLDCFEFVGGS